MINTTTNNNNEKGATKMRMETNNERRARIANNSDVQGILIDKIENARDRVSAISDLLDDRLGIDPDAISSADIEIVELVVEALDNALTACEKTSDLNQAIAQSRSDNPAAK